MEHTHDEGRTSLAPDQVIVLSECQEELRDHVGVFKKTTLVIAEGRGGRRGGRGANRGFVRHVS